MMDKLYLAQISFVFFLWSTQGRVRIFLAVVSWSCCISVALGFTAQKDQVIWVQIRTG